MGATVLEVFQPPDGGIPEHVTQLAEGLPGRDFELLVAAPAATAARSRLEQAGARFQAVEMVGPITPGGDLAALRALRELARRPEVGLVHAHGQKAGLLARAAALRAGKPSIYTPHSFVYATQLARPRPTTQLRLRVSRLAERFLGRRSAAIVAVAGSERDIAVRDRLISPERIHVIHNGVRVDAQAAPDERLAAFRGEGPLFGIVAGLRDQKGIPTLLEALELLAARSGQPRFAVVGNGPLREEAERRTASGPLAETTLLLPFEAPVEPYLAALDVFVLPSYWEGLSIAVLEAMAMGLPVIASAVGGTPEAVADGVSGLLVPPHDAEALADAITRLAGDPAARERMGAEGARRAAEQFDTERMVEQTAELYRSLLGPPALA